MDYYGIVGNVISDHALRTGAKVWVLRNHYENVYVIGLSKGGRSIRKFIQTKRLRDIRVVWVPAWIRNELCGSESAEQMQQEMQWLVKNGATVKTVEKASES